MNRITPDYITFIKPGEVFVFGSNLSGIHGAGAAKQALRFGAIFGRAEGLQGKCYAIPTKDKTITRALPLNEIEIRVKKFIMCARVIDKEIFLVTAIGCGLAGLNPSQIAPMFADAKKYKNIFLPKSFWEVIS